VVGIVNQCVVGQVLSGELASVFNVQPPGVGLMQKVAAGSPAEPPGLRRGTMRARIGDEDLILGGDIVLSLMGFSVDRSDCLVTVLAKAAIARHGERMDIIVLRGGRIVGLGVLVHWREPVLGAVSRLGELCAPFRSMR